ncbi:hypothetical protein ACWDRR_35975 [Kitasatospora sp. NPDC003701]
MPAADARIALVAAQLDGDAALVARADDAAAARRSLLSGWQLRLQERCARTRSSRASSPGGVLPPPGSQDLRPDGTAGLLLLPRADPVAARRPPHAVPRRTGHAAHAAPVPRTGVGRRRRQGPGEGRVHFLDPDTLTPRPAPPALTGAEHLSLIATSPDGRCVAYAGQLAVGEPRRRRDVDWHSRLHDLDHAGAVLQRPLTGLRLAATMNLRGALLEARRTGNTHLHHLFTLALALAERSSGD